MTEILDLILTILFNFMPLSFIIGLIGFVFLLIFRLANNKKKNLILGIILISQTVFTWIVSFGILWGLQKQARQELIEFLDQPNLIVTLNGKTIGKQKSTEFVANLEKIEKTQSHHSYPTIGMDVEINSLDKTVCLRLERDSEIMTEFWVFWKKYQNTKTNEIGRVRMSPTGTNLIENETYD